jgi:hypothetical protein
MSERQTKENAPLLARYGGDPETKKAPIVGAFV